MARSLLPLFLRLILASGLLTAAGARFGLIAAPAAWDAFSRWTTRLWGLAPLSIQPVLGWVVVGIEIVLGLLILVGFRTRQMALATGVLLLATALAMWLRAGIQSPFHAAVFAYAGVAFTLAALGPGRIAIERS